MNKSLEIQFRATVEMVNDAKKIKVDLTNRVETGAIQINDDWPGTFIRGDRSLYLATILQSISDKVFDHIDWIEQMELQYLIRLLSECHSTEVQT